MKANITHVALYARDMEKSREYYTKYFGGISNEKYQNTKGFSSYFITFDSGARLEIMNHLEQEEQLVKDKVTGLSHLAFTVGSKGAVMQLTEQITNAGFKMYSPPRMTGDGYFESCVADPDGNRIEISE